MRDATAIKSTNGFTQVLRASSSERDADGDEEDEEMGRDDIKPRVSLDYHLSPTLIVQEILRSSPPAASPSPPSTTVQTPKDITILAAASATISKKSKKRPSSRTEPPKKKGIAKPQKKKRKVVVEDEDLEDETSVRPLSKKKKNLTSNTGRAQALIHRPVSFPPVKQQADSPPNAPSLSSLPLPPLPKYNADGMELYCVCRKPDSGKWMIGCDGCEDWFHGECINVAEEDGDLIDKYFCKTQLPNPFTSEFL